MVRLFGVMLTRQTTVVAVTFLMAGCGYTAAPQQGGGVNIDPAALLASIGSNSAQLTAAKALAGWEWLRFFTDFGTILSKKKYNLEMQKVTYQSTGADGKQHSMTDLLILPTAGGAKQAVPILMYQHGAEPYRTYSPSQFLSYLDRPADYPEVMVAAAIASTGYAVAMADYEGMGDNTSIQPYVHGTTLVGQVIDMLRASRDLLDVTTGSSSSPCSWNSQLFLMGYSEGGYGTMTVTRELQLKHAGEFTVTASAPLSGPHDLSGVMRGAMLSDIPSKATYFLPFVLTSFNYAYGGRRLSSAPTTLSRLPGAEPWVYLA